MTAPLDRFSDMLAAEGLSQNTRRAYVADLDGFLRWADDFKVDPNGQGAPDYLNWLRKADYSNASINRKAAALRKYYGDALAKYKAPPAPEGEPHPLPNLMDDVRKMLAVTDGEIRLAIALMGFAGLRISETLMLCWQDIAADEIIVYGKGSKIRRVPIAPELEAILDQVERPVSGPELFTMSERGLRKAVTTAGERAMIDRPVSSHDLRMTFGTVIYNFCKDIRVVQELLGHSSSKTTERYTGVAQAARSAAVTGALP